MNTSPVLLLLTLLLSTCHGEEQTDSDASTISAAMKPQKLEMPLEASCPDPADIEPCVCTNVGRLIMDCSYIQDENQLWQVFSAYFPTTAFYELNIENNEGLKVLENGVFHNVSFQRIVIQNGGLQEVEDEALNPSLSNLTDISIEICQLATFPFERLPEMTSLEFLSLYNNSIPSIPPLSSSTLEVLQLTDNPISTLPRDAFKSLPAITALHLDSCQLTEITPGTFEDLPELNQVYLSNNKLRYIQSFTFQNVYMSDSPSVINLSNNTIDFVEVDAFEGVPEYSAINMNYNVLSRLPEREWRPVLEKGIIVELTGNPLICGCDVAWLVRNPQLLAGTEYARCPNGTYLTELDPADFSMCG